MAWSKTAAMEIAALRSQMAANEQLLLRAIRYSGSDVGDGAKREILARLARLAEYDAAPPTIDADEAVSALAAMQKKLDASHAHGRALVQQNVAQGHDRDRIKSALTRTTAAGEKLAAIVREMVTDGNHWADCDCTDCQALSAWDRRDGEVG